MESEFRRLPSVDKLLSEENIQRLESLYPHDLLVSLVRQQLEEARQAIVAGKLCPSADEMVASVGHQLTGLGSLSLRPVVNATGVILHTNLGRAPLSREAIAAMDIIARSYCNLEFELDSSTRGSRHVHIEPILCQLTGAEAALVVNNNASAVLLVLSALARRKEVIVSRGQAVEIGGSFRIPDVMRQSGVKLLEVGTTNCTYLADYEQAISPHTVAMMLVHSSNFQIIGFTHSVPLEGLVVLGQQHDLPVLDDMGSGCFMDTGIFGLDPEPTVRQSVAAGAGLVFFSGDKLVGGPQAGIIVGQKRYIDKLKKHPLARAVRIDKIRLAGLAATLIHYLKGEAVAKIPVWSMIAAPVTDIQRRAGKWAAVLGDLAEVVDGESMVGGGSLPGSTLPTKLVAIGGAGGKKGRRGVQVLAQKLRGGAPPVVGRIGDDVLFLDPRTVLPEEDEAVLKALKSLGTD
ncbi:L-seryl-tRNA(Sec) selenium transferase [Chloroflexota bacterium]